LIVSLHILRRIPLERKESFGEYVKDEPKIAQSQNYIDNIPN